MNQAAVNEPQVTRYNSSFQVPFHAFASKDTACTFAFLKTSSGFRQKVLYAT